MFRRVSKLILLLNIQVSFSYCDTLPGCLELIHGATRGYDDTKKEHRYMNNSNQKSVSAGSLVMQSNYCGGEDLSTVVLVIYGCEDQVL